MDVLTNPATLPVLVTALAAIVVGVLGLRGVLAKTDAESTGLTIKSLMDRITVLEQTINAERHDANEWRAKFFDQLREVGLLRVELAQVEARVIALTGDLDVLQRREVAGGDPLDRRARTPRVRLPGELVEEAQGGAA